MMSGGARARARGGPRGPRGGRGQGRGLRIRSSPGLFDVFPGEDGTGFVGVKGKGGVGGLGGWGWALCSCWLLIKAVMPYLNSLKRFLSVGDRSKKVFHYLGLSSFRKTILF